MGAKGELRPSLLSGASLALALLVAINLFNYIDRNVLAALVPSIRASFATRGENISSQQMGYLAPAFLVSYMVAAPIFGWLGDRGSRWKLIALGVVLWSLASGASGLAGTFMALLFTRCFVGIGEAAYGPVAPTVIADLYPVERRGRVLAWFYCAIPVGSALGYTLGGQVTGHVDALQAATDNWRRGFFLVVPPGIALGLLCLLMPEPRRGQSEGVSSSGARKLGWSDFRRLFTIRSYTLNTLGMAAMTFAFGGLAFWMPTYLVEERGAPRVGSIDCQTMFGGLTALAGLFGTLAGGLAGDRLRSRFGGAYFLVSGSTMIIGFPMVLLFLWTPFPGNWFVIFVTVFCLFFNTGPTNTILANVTHPSIRANAFALNIFIIHILGDVISPPIMGWIRDNTPNKSFVPAFIVVSLMILIGGIIWLRGARYLDEDTRLAPFRPVGDA
jgi:MFS family permease